MRAKVRVTVAALLLIGGGGALPAQPAWASAGAFGAAHEAGMARYAPEPQPPDLPQVSNGACVGESPVAAKTTPWAVGRMAPADVWPLSRGNGVVVAVVDTGVSAAATGLTGAVQRGTDVVGGGRADQDCLGRGTALAGIVAARPVTGSVFVGVAPGVSVLPIRIVDRKGEIAPGAIADGIRSATAAGADVVLLGVGTPTPDADLRSAVRAALARDIVLVASVSDAKPSVVGQNPPPWYPASDPNVLAVGGIDMKGVPTEKSVEASGVDLLAPAAGAVTVAPRGAGHYTVGGPGVAAAYAAGAAALVRAYYPQLSEAEVRRRLELTAEHPLGKWPTPEVGYGTLDLYSAMTVLDLDETPQPMEQAAFVPMRAPAPTDPAKGIAAWAATGTVGVAVAAYLLMVTVRWGRRRRWRP
ncbi:S8 family serine peptidase [Micromonospora arborensis]|uniref:S8 family serine peptidase n=1 Tax=Micromonospora arborensis TaxID=2116518 RepID=UPI0011B63923|nr:S8 family serine peptidase [Micromonospora arborensis]